MKKEELELRLKEVGMDKDIVFKREYKSIYTKESDMEGGEYETVLLIDPLKLNTAKFIYVNKRLIQVVGSITINSIERMKNLLK
jgi:hypothetical protein